MRKRLSSRKLQARLGAESLPQRVVTKRLGRLGFKYAEHQPDFRFAAFRKAGKLIDKISRARADERTIPSPHTLSAT